MNALHTLSYAGAFFIGSNLASFVSKFISSFLAAAKRPLSADALFVLERMEDLAELLLWIAVMVHALRHVSPDPCLTIASAFLLVAVVGFFIEKKFGKVSSRVFWLRISVSFAACLWIASVVAEHLSRTDLA
ncbi:MULTISPECIES: hypothetical protein [unclassified Rhizobacter]|uniref:hypothetical protein n=1 Tax=unclassified Rhizobacter TaxID=2640088 RepID=UPI0006FC0C15|nr:MULTISPECIES: hypothetical protein [unclassified Rhizobacter]KQU74963.1 hypothetical protein ASC88_26490 [Rhizobacter sp. Root29]KQW00962.1 hypothetical protein ASC98_06475 [Rhizobacter sp. Root1238]KRB03812.1 hypothetical protein ASE08_13980 [Rhizobacter sp. Root16D2]